MTKDEQWMKIAIGEAQLAMDENEVPVGAVLVQNNKLIAQAHNQPIKNNDPTAHAEILAIRKAGDKLNNYRLPNSTLYVTLEPCLMCFGAIIHSRIDRVVYGASDSKNNFYDKTTKLLSQSIFNNKIALSHGILENECKEILNKFFILKRKSTLKNSN